MTDFFPIFGMIVFGAALGGVVTFAALYLVGRNGGVIVPPELTDAEREIAWNQIVIEQRRRGLTAHGSGTGGNVDAVLWPVRVVRQKRIVGAMRERAS